MPYHVAFDVAQAGFQWWPSLLIALVSSIIILFGWAAETGGDEEDNEAGGLLLRYGGIAGLVGSVVFLAFTYQEYRSAVQVLSSHEYIVASGVVSGFARRTGGRFSSTIESFSVNGAHFEYGSGLSSAAFGGYWNTGFIRDGADVRISYSRDHDILRVEVK